MKRLLLLCACALLASKPGYAEQSQHAKEAAPTREASLDPLNEAVKAFDEHKKYDPLSSQDTLKYLAAGESIVDQYIHRTVQSLACENFSEVLLFAGARLALLRGKNEKKDLIMLGNDKFGILSRLQQNIVAWCNSNPGTNNNDHRVQLCADQVMSGMKSVTSIFFNFATSHPDLDTNEKLVQSIRAEFANPQSELASAIEKLKENLNQLNEKNHIKLKCNRDVGVKPFDTSFGQKLKPSGKYSEDPPRDSFLKNKIMRAAREMVKVSQDDSAKMRALLQSKNPKKGIFKTMRDGIGHIFHSDQDEDEIIEPTVAEQDLTNPKNGYEKSSSRYKCYRYVALSYAAAGMIDHWPVDQDDAKNADTDMLPKLLNKKGQHYFNPVLVLRPNERPAVRTKSANDLIQATLDLDKDKSGLYVAIFDSDSTPGHIETIFWNSDKSQWECYSDYMAPVYDKNRAAFRYGGYKTNTLKAIYKLDETL